MLGHLIALIRHVGNPPMIVLSGHNSKSKNRSREKSGVEVPIPEREWLSKINDLEGAHILCKRSDRSTLLIRLVLMLHYTAEESEVDTSDDGREDGRFLQRRVPYRKIVEPSIG